MGHAVRLYGKARKVNAVGPLVIAAIRNGESNGIVALVQRVKPRASRNVFPIAPVIYRKLAVIELRKGVKRVARVNGIRVFPARYNSELGQSNFGSFNLEKEIRFGDYIPRSERSLQHVPARVHGINSERPANGQLFGQLNAAHESRRILRNARIRERYRTRRPRGSYLRRGVARRLIERPVVYVQARNGNFTAFRNYPEGQRDSLAPFRPLVVVHRVVVKSHGNGVSSQLIGRNLQPVAVSRPVLNQVVRHVILQGARERNDSHYIRLKRRHGLNRVYRVVIELCVRKQKINSPLVYSVRHGNARRTAFERIISVGNGNLDEELSRNRRCRRRVSPAHSRRITESVHHRKR